MKTEQLVGRCPNCGTKTTFSVTEEPIMGTARMFDCLGVERAYRFGFDAATCDICQHAVPRQDEAFQRLGQEQAKLLAKDLSILTAEAVVRSHLAIEAYLFKVSLISSGVSVLVMLALSLLMPDLVVLAVMVPAGALIWAATRGVKGQVSASIHRWGEFLEKAKVDRQSPAAGKE